jgi:glycosyltransferase involved in cell wall biosynthesis
LRICFIGDGRSIHTHHWASHFARIHDVHLITYDPAGTRLPGVEEHVVGSAFQNPFLSFIPRQLAIGRLIDEIRPDLIHAHFITKYGFHLPFFRRIPSIVSAWGDDILVLPRASWAIRQGTACTLRSVNRIYAVSRDIRDRIICEYAIDPAKVCHVPFGVDPAIFSPETGSQGDGARSLRLFSNRKFYPVYDHETMVEGFALACRTYPEMRLVLKGTGPLEPAIRRQIASVGLQSKISVEHWTSHDDVAGDLRGSDIFISTALSDGSPVSLLEAMATGLACIATSVGGVPEWIADRETGLLIPSRDPGALARAVLTLARDPGFRRRLGEKARAEILARGDWQRIMEKVEKDYEALVRPISRRAA